ncbi:hypothetical protein EI427_06855 [Flammeovirga pectinis]|uniref:Uncharacterized protein n=1 Tax=Flammeovirga pectinis TaxID=2494373 RepID=A0A3Q9FK49_9BACT|nr:hypothetical protein [Flammeovirga pectinis]AZQ61966.1 hypothetical protein EI427_06855 [Flammeovirga pectinis]
MKNLICSFIVLFTLSNFNNTIAQNFESTEDLKKFYKKNAERLPSPQNGWFEAWVIMPSEEEFEHHTDGEVQNARVFVKDGEVLRVFYDNDAYLETVYTISDVKNGKAKFQKVFLDINHDLTEVFSAYTHTVIFKDHKAEVEAPLKAGENIGNVVFYSNSKKIQKQGFFVFVRNKTTEEYDFIGYLNKKYDESKEALDEVALQIPMIKGDYEIFSVQNKIQFNRRMPMNKHEIDFMEEASHQIELVAKK